MGSGRYRLGARFARASCGGTARFARVTTRVVLFTVLFSYLFGTSSPQAPLTRSKVRVLQFALFAVLFWVLEGFAVLFCYRVHDIRQKGLQYSSGQIGLQCSTIFGGEA